MIEVYGEEVVPNVGGNPVCIEAGFETFEGIDLRFNHAAECCKTKPTLVTRPE